LNGTSAHGKDERRKEERESARIEKGKQQNGSDKQNVIDLLYDLGLKKRNEWE